jgi:hypothetical protein
MDATLTRFLNKTQKVYRKLSNLREPYTSMKLDYGGQAASDLIKSMIAGNEPCMICRFGRTEMGAILRYLNIIDNRSLLIKSIKYIQGEIDSFWWDNEIKFSMSNLAGFFPANEEFLAKFGDRILRDIRNIDILGSWIVGEARLLKFFSEAKIVRLRDLEPYYHSHQQFSV